MGRVLTLAPGTAAANAVLSRLCPSAHAIGGCLQFAAVCEQCYVVPDDVVVGTWTEAGGLNGCHVGVKRATASSLVLAADLCERLPNFTRALLAGGGSVFAADPQSESDGDGSGASDWFAAVVANCTTGAPLPFPVTVAATGAPLLSHMSTRVAALCLRAVSTDSDRGVQAVQHWLVEALATGVYSHTAGLCFFGRSHLCCG